MIRRLAIVFSLTGTAHLMSIFVLRWLALHAPSDQIAGLGEFESLIQLIIGLIGFGMQSDAVRKIAVSENWKDKLTEAQTARLTLGILLAGLTILTFSKTIYLTFLFAPLFAVSADYALYARGVPIAGAFVAFIRVALPLALALGVVQFWPDQILLIYILATGITYFVTNSLIAFFLKVKLFYSVSLPSLRLYARTIPLGIISLTLYFLGLGILLVAQLVFDNKQLVISVLALKFYTIFKGVIRVIHQAFITEMQRDQVCQTIDQLGIMISLCLVGSAMIFPTTFISFLFGHQFANHPLYFALLAFAALSFSVFSSLNTRLILDHEDVSLMKISILSCFVAVGVLLLSTRFGLGPESVPLSLLIAELFYSISLATLFFNWDQIWQRISFLFTTAPSLIIPGIAVFIFGENLYSYFISFALMGIVLFLFNRKGFFIPPANPEKATDQM